MGGSFGQLPRREKWMSGKERCMCIIKILDRVRNRFKK